MSMFIRRKAVIPVWVILFGLLALYMSPLTVGTGALLLLGAIVVPDRAHPVAGTHSRFDEAMIHFGGRARDRRRLRSTSMSNQITYGDDSRTAILRGINSLANAVRVTLGPRVVTSSWAGHSARRRSRRTASRWRRRSA